MLSSIKSWIESKKKSPFCASERSEMRVRELNEGTVLIHDPYDQWIFEEAARSIDILKSLLEAGEEVEEGFRNRVSDLFALFYKAEPEFIENAEGYITYSYFVDLLSNETIRKKRKETRYHILNSLIFAIQYAKEWLKSVPQEHSKADNLKGLSALTPGLGKELRAWGAGLHSTLHLNLDQVIRLINLVSNDAGFLTLAQRVGRLQDLARGVRGKKIPAASHSNQRITQSNDIYNAIPTELALLASEKTKPVFYQKYKQSNLLTYDQRRSVKKERGSMIVFVDTSDSLSGKKGYITKAIAACLCQVARKENRWISVIVFSGGNAIQEFVFDPQSPKPDEFVEMATLFFGGGTCFDECIEMGLSRMHDKNFKEADWIFISDFAGTVETSLLEQVKELKRTVGLRWFSLKVPTREYHVDLLCLSDSIEELSLEFGDGLDRNLQDLLIRI